MSAEDVPPSTAAARVKLPARATATKACRSSSLGGVVTRCSQRCVYSPLSRQAGEGSNIVPILPRFIAEIFSQALADYTP